MWVWWTIAAVALAVGEMAIMGFFLAPFAGGAFVAAIFSLAGAGAAPSIVAFAVITALLFLFVRPVAQRHLHQPAEFRTGTAALIGERGLVLEPVDGQNGRIKLKGEVWSARTYDPSTSIEAGRSVEIVQIDGATAIVYESEG